MSARIPAITTGVPERKFGGCGRGCLSAATTRCILKVMRDQALGLIHMDPGACGPNGWHMVALCCDQPWKTGRYPASGQSNWVRAGADKLPGNQPEPWSQPGSRRPLYGQGKTHLRVLQFRRSLHYNTPMRTLSFAVFFLCTALAAQAQPPDGGGGAAGTGTAPGAGGAPPGGRGRGGGGGFGGGGGRGGGKTSNCSREPTCRPRCSPSYRRWAFWIKEPAAIATWKTAPRTQSPRR